MNLYFKSASDKCCCYLWLTQTLQRQSHSRIRKWFYLFFVFLFCFAWNIERNCKRRMSMKFLLISKILWNQFSSTWFKITLSTTGIHYYFYWIVLVGMLSCFRISPLQINRWAVWAWHRSIAKIHIDLVCMMDRAAQTNESHFQTTVHLKSRFKWISRR